MSPTVLVCLAHGSEEIEAVTVIDLLTIAEIPVTTASTADNGELVLTCSRGVKIVADTQLVNIIEQDFTAIVLPGGLKGAEAFRDNPLIIEKIRQSHHLSKIIAAICAVPAIVLEHHNLFPIGNMTGYPALQSKIASHKRVDCRVYYDERVKLLTSQGPATVIDFSLKLIELLVGKKRQQKLLRSLSCRLVFTNMPTNGDMANCVYSLETRLSLRRKSQWITTKGDTLLHF